ncbi:MAG: Septum formation protein Maf [Chlamydiae bacterium]|nr:Septum formation protein Maf [Chlamydiota bacterium]
MKIILASQSTFRKKALDILGLDYVVIPSYFDEKSIRNDDPLLLASLLSEAKARKVGEKETNAIIISSDAFIVYRHSIFEKPNNKQEAAAMLSSLSGQTFELITGLAVYDSGADKMQTAVESLNIEFRPLEEYEINDYVDRYPVTKLAGGFEVEGIARFSHRIEGNCNLLTALPLNRLVLCLRELGLKI